MSFEEKYHLTTNPFRITPAVSSEEIVWAGFSGLKNKFIKRIKRSIKIPNSSLILNWGEYGSGKTHAARFFCSKKQLEIISKEVNSKPPYSFTFPLPKGKDPVYSIYISVIDKLDIKQIRNDFDNQSILKFIDLYSDNLQVQSILSAIFNENVEDVSLLKKYLYGNVTNTELKKLNQYGILRHLKSDSDYTKVLAGLFTCLTFNKLVYSSIILWIDEFEDLAILSSSNIDKTNNFIREILDNTPNNLLIFINLTQSALFGQEDLGEYVSEAVRSRIRDRINFDLPSEQDLKDYYLDLVTTFRAGKVDDEYAPFSSELISKIIAELGNVSIRSFNEALSMTLELADLEDVVPISIEFFEKYKEEIIGWKQE
ncbi:MAG: hypothetical protein WD357_02020 [Gracilimonas sp.]